MPASRSMHHIPLRIGGNLGTDRQTFHPCIQVAEDVVEEWSAPIVSNGGTTRRPARLIASLNR